MKKVTKNILRIVISLVYIIWGIMSPITAFQALVALDPVALASAAVSVLMLLAGILGLIGVKKATCRVFGVIIFVFALVTAILSVFSGINVQAIVTAVLAWLFIVCL